MVKVQRIHRNEDGEEGDYDRIIVNGEDIGSSEQLNWEDILHAAGFSYKVNNDSEEVEVITYSIGD